MAPAKQAYYVWMVLLLLLELLPDSIQLFQKNVCRFSEEELRACCPAANSKDEPIIERDIVQTSTASTKLVTSIIKVMSSKAEDVDSQGKTWTKGTKPRFLPTVCGVFRYKRLGASSGRKAEQGSWPWLAIVYREKQGFAKHSCDGTLITSQHVVTAANCIVGKDDKMITPNDFRVRLGVHDIMYSDDDEKDSVDIKVISIVKHENYNPRTFENDIVILKLEHPVQFDNNISPICLPYDSLRNKDLTGRVSFVPGKGTTFFMEVQDQETCKEIYKPDLLITDAYLCAATLDSSRDSCQGISGDPLMSVGKENRFYLIGILSFGKACHFPSVYVRVTNHLDWLQNHLST